MKNVNKNHRLKEQKTHCTTLQCFAKQEAKLLNFMINIR